ncbi:MAG: tetratricopeptide repeat protein, partial [Spirochaetota bacterium]
RDYDSAIRYLNLAVSGGDGAAIDLFNLGLAHLSTGERDKAIEFFQKAEAKGSEDMELISRLADVYTSSYNNYNKGIELYSQLAEKRSGNTEILLKLGELYYQNNDYNSALVYFRRVSEMEGASHNAKRAYMYLGTIYDENQRYEDALDAYRSAIEIDPTDAAAFYNMGIAYRNMGDTVNAVENWKKAYQLNPDNPRPLIATADLLYENDYLDEAAAEYVNIVEKWPSNSSALFSLATIYNRKENRASARKYYNKVIELDADRELVKKSLINLALLSVEEEDTQATAEQLSESVAMIKKALMISPGDNEALYALGVIYYKKELYERAVETFYQVIKAEKHPEEIAKAYNNIGKAYFQMGEYRKAVRAFSLGIEEDPSNEEIRINRRSASQKYEQEIGAAAN